MPVVIVALVVGIASVGIAAAILEWQARRDRARERRPGYIVGGPDS